MLTRTKVVTFNAVNEDNVMEVRPRRRANSQSHLRLFCDNFTCTRDRP